MARFAWDNTERFREMSAGVQTPAHSRERGSFPPGLLNFLPAFYGLSQEEAREISEIITTITYSKEQVIFDESSLGDALYVVVRGRVDIRVRDALGNSRTIASLPEGSILGEMSLLDQQSRSASAVASEESLLLTMSVEDFHNLMERDSIATYKVVYNLGRVLAQRLRSVNERLVRTLSREGQQSAASDEEVTELERKLLTEWNF
jgi:CRP/FNR family transcriptional regulator, cyclic AMP receptor protein